MVFSNVPGFVKPVTYAGGGIVKRFFSLLSGPGLFATSVSCVSILKRCHLSLTADESEIADLPLFMSYFEDLISEYNLKYSEDEEGKD